MKTKTLLTVGALAVLGVLAYNYYNKKKETGYSNLTGGSQKWCKKFNPNVGWQYDTAHNGADCPKGWSTASEFGG
jgi:uncharacterized membrane protein YebE (DUF533 family)